MSDTTLMDCNCCGLNSDCIDGLCEDCNEYNYKENKVLRAKIAELEKQIEVLSHNVEEKDALFVNASILNDQLEAENQRLTEV